MEPLPYEQTGTKERRCQGGVAHDRSVRRPDDRLFSAPLVCHRYLSPFPVLRVLLHHVLGGLVFLFSAPSVIASVIHVGETFSPRIERLDEVDRQDSRGNQLCEYGVVIGATRFPQQNIACPFAESLLFALRDGCQLCKFGLVSLTFAE